MPGGSHEVPRNQPGMYRNVPPISFLTAAVYKALLKLQFSDTLPFFWLVLFSLLNYQAKPTFPDRSRGRRPSRLPAPLVSASPPLWYVCAKLLQSYPTVCDPVDCSPPGSSVHGVLQARVLERVPRPPPGDLPDPGVEPASLLSAPSAGRFLATAPPGTSKSTTALGQITLLSQHTRSYAQVTRSIFMGICIWGSDGPVRIVWLLVPPSLPRLPHLSRPALRSNGFCG